MIILYSPPKWLNKLLTIPPPKLFLKNIYFSIVFLAQILLCFFVEYHHLGILHKDCFLTVLFCCKINNNVTIKPLQSIIIYDIMATSENSSKKGLIFLKKAISLLLIITTLIGCCSFLFACSDDEDKDSKPGVKNLENKSAVVLDVATLGLEAGKTRDEGAVTTVKWTLSPTNSSSRVFKANLAKKGLEDYKEVTFWMYNESSESVKFVFYFLGADGKTKYRAQTDLDNPYIVRVDAAAYDNVVDTETIDWLVAQPGWHQYTIPLDEVDALSGQNRVDYAYNTSTGKADIKFDKSSIVGIEINAESYPPDNNVTLHVGSVNANTNKYGTIKGFGIYKISNAVCFYKESNFCLYNQLRYCLVDDEAASVGTVNESVYVPIAMLAEHRGANISVNTKEEVTFIYNGVTTTFRAGQTFEYLSNERAYNPGIECKATTSSIGEYLTIPMEVAASVLGYELFYDPTGLAIFSDRPNPTEGTDWTNWTCKTKDAVNGVVDKDDVMFVSSNDLNYMGTVDGDGIPDRQMGYIAQITKVITFDYYTGQDLLADMDELHGEDSHGNLIITDAQIEKLKELVETDTTYKAWFTAYEAKYAVGSAAYTSKLPYYNLPDGQRVERGCASDIKVYAFLYRMTDNEDYAERAVKIMEALLKYKDPVTKITKEMNSSKVREAARSWHPEHYLDVGMIQSDFAIGYDWCYDYLAEDEERLEKIETLTWEYAYGPMMGFGDLFEWWFDRDNYDSYNNYMLNDGDPNTTTAPWYDCRFPFRAFDNSSRLSSLTKPDTYLATKHQYNTAKFGGNWNQVIMNGSIQIAFAFANVNPEFRAASEYILTIAVNNMTYGIVDCLSPDGGQPEGPSYWHFGIQYQMCTLETLKNCTGSYHGLNDFCGFEDSYDYTLGIASNTLAWNFHDCPADTVMQTNQFFMAARMFNNPSLAEYRFNKILSGTSTNFYDMIYYDPAICKENTNIELNLDYISYKLSIATFRSDWSDGQMYCGLHGGANNEAHGQLDIGNFILEYNGTRFFQDLGSDEYGNGLGYFSYPQRHWLYVNRAEGQNTLVINPSYVDQSYYADGKKRWNSGTDSNGNEASRYVDVWKCDYYQRSDMALNYDQAYSAVSTIEEYATSSNASYAVVDIGGAYAYYSRALQGFEEYDSKYMVSPTGKRGLLVLENRSTVVIQDEMDISKLDVATDTVLWMGHIVDGGTITISADKQSALISHNGNTLLCKIVTPAGYTNSWIFESRSADYLRETGLFLTAGEFSRDGKQKLVAVGTITDDDVKLAIVCKPISAGPHNYEWTNIADWNTLVW